MNAILKVLTICACLEGVSNAFAFTDPLDQPAILSERAVASPLYGISGDGKKKIVVVGPRGHILHSEDAGQHFIQSPSPLSSDLVAVYFANQALGWAVGHDGVILHSADGGKSWERQLDGRQMGDLAAQYYASLPADTDGLSRSKEYALNLQDEGPTKPLMDIYFENESDGWAIGAFNLILHTTDGGKHWVPWMERTENPDEYSLHSIRKIGGHIYIAGELGLLLRLDRDQQRFVQLDSPYSGSLFGLTGRSELLVIFGLRGNAYTSRDNGNSWTELDTQTSNSINTGTMLPDGRFVLGSTGGELLFSNANGDSIVKTISTSRPIYGIAAIADTNLITIGPNGARVISQK